METSFYFHFGNENFGNSIAAIMIYLKNEASTLADKMY